MQKTYSLRIRVISLAIILFACLAIVRLYFLQIVYGEDFASQAERQYVNTATVSYDRGNIYFQSKTGELTPAAMTRSGYTVAINPELIKDPEKVYRALSPLINLDKSDFFAKSGKKTDPYEEIGRKINQETADKITALNLEGVTLSTEKWRFYPALSAAAQIIGFVSFKGNNLYGSYGLEKYYEDVLRRDPAKMYKNFFADLFSNLGDTVSGAPSQGDLVTTIEPNVEIFLQDKLKETRIRWGSDEAGGIIINPKTGEIYAAAFDPSFDLNSFQLEKNPQIYGDPLVDSVFEMGSIMKALTMASGLDSGTVTASSTYNDTGCLNLNEKKICNYDLRARGIIPMQEVLSQSLNVGASYVALKMGNSKFSTYMKSFGFGTETGIDLPSETKGLVNNLDSKREIEMATASYGQGIAVTPVEMVRALSALANGGQLITPHVVKEIKYDSGLSNKITYEDTKQVFKPETSKEITRMLVHVVDTALANGKAKIPEYSVAAKTGTAQMATEGHAGYTDGKYLHSFFGYFPASDPKFLVFLFHTYPKGVKYASETLTEPFMDITHFLINYYEVPPDR
jgi:cell division protein FtsI (penicillin-binding protein 3)